MRVLVIGGTAFMGPFVVRALHEQGHDVAIFHRGRTEALLPEGVRHLHGEREQFAAFAAEFKVLAPDVVLDMVSMIEDDARALLAAFTGVAGRTVALSSVNVYRAYGRLHGSEPGPPEPVPLTEASPVRERLYPYRGSGVTFQGRSQDGYDKIPIERLLLGEPRLPGTVLRLPMAYGPGDYIHRLFPHLKRMDDGRAVIPLPAAFARWRWSRGYVEEMADAIALAVTDDGAAGRIYNVAEPDALSMADWVRQAGAVVGWAGEVVVLQDGALPTPVATAGLAQDLVTDTTRIRTELGYAEHLSRPEALRRTIAWERAHPPEQISPEMFDYAAEDAALAAAR